MGKTNKSGLGIGIGSSPQIGIVQGEYDNKIEELIDKNNMIQPLIDAGVKFNKDDVIFVVKDKLGEMVWLEKGNEEVGLSHILNKHSSDYQEEHMISKEKIVDHIREIITNGNVEYSRFTLKGNRLGVEKMYLHNGKYYLLAGIGTNGFIVSAYPVRENTAKKLLERYKNNG